MFTVQYFRVIGALWGYLILFYYKNIFRKTTWGSKIRFYGVPILRFYGKSNIGNNVVLLSKTKYNMVGIVKPCSIMVENGAVLIIGSYTGFSGVTIYCANSIIIGKYCNFGGNVSIWDTDFHPIDFKLRRSNSLDIVTKPIVIGDDVFVGAHSIILKGVTIGDRVIIGAGSVVTKSIPSDEIWAGNPAKFINKRSDDI